MSRAMQIRVGLISEGKPVLEPCETAAGPGYRLKNMLIGAGFHWQKVMEAIIPGEIHMLAEPQGKIYCLNVLPVETYLLSVIASEMNPNAPVEFLKAHAVISRSWAARKIARNEVPVTSGRIFSGGTYVSWEESDSHVGFDVCSDDHCQRYQGVGIELPDNVRRAVSDTSGLVLRDSAGNVADARFSKCCGGVTERFSSCWADIDHSYLISREDPWCDLSHMNPEERSEFLRTILKDYDVQTVDFYDWEETVDKEELRKRLLEYYGEDTGRITGLTPLRRGPSGRITLLEIAGEKGKVRIGKELPVRRLLSPGCLYSSRFSVEDSGDSFRLKGRGWGHGVGLCQIGAARMAHEGWGFRDILEFYYPGTQIGTPGPDSH